MSAFGACCIRVFLIYIQVDTLNGLLPFRTKGRQGSNPMTSYYPSATQKSILEGNEGRVGCYRALKGNRGVSGHSYSLSPIKASTSCGMQIDLFHICAYLSTVYVCFTCITDSSKAVP